MKEELSNNNEKNTEETEHTEKAEHTEQNENTVPNEKKDQSILKNDPLYKSGKRFYDIGLALFSLILIFNLVINFLNIELYIAGVICTEFLIFLYLIPCVIMIISLTKSVKAAKKLGVRGKGDKTCLIISVVLAVFIVFGGAFEAFYPSYHIYEAENVKVSDGKTFMAVESETVKMFGERHSEMPSFYDIDVYEVNGIFAKRLIRCSAHEGEYRIEKIKDGKYKLTISFLGREEGYPFEG